MVWILKSVFTNLERQSIEPHSPYWNPTDLWENYLEKSILKETKTGSDRMFSLAVNGPTNFENVFMKWRINFQGQSSDCNLVC